MKIYISVIISIGIAILLSCSKEEPIAQNLHNELAFTANENSLIMDTDTTMRILTIDNYADSLILRKECVNIIADSTNEVLMQLIDRMMQTVDGVGLGLAGPQIGINRNIIIVQRIDKPNRPYEVYLNPVITQESELKKNSTEGCLSVPNQQGSVERHNAIVLTYDTPDGVHHEDIIAPLSIARIFQHEIDHLHGKLYIDDLVQ